MQLVLNILIAWSFVGLAGGGIALVQSVTRQVPLALAAVIAVGVHVCHALQWNGWPMWLATAAAVITSVVLSISFDFWIDRLVLASAKGKMRGWPSVAVALGLLIVVQSLLGLLFGEGGRTFSLARSTFRLGSAQVTWVQAYSLTVTVAVLSGLIVFLGYTRAGVLIRGLGSNPDLCTIYGVNVRNVRAFAVGLGGGTTALAGILWAADSGLVASTGFSVLLVGLTAAIIGGADNTHGVAIAALIIVGARNISAYFGDPQWMDAMTFVVLSVFLVIMPSGLSGRRLRKVEI